LTDHQTKVIPDLPSVTLCAVDCLNPVLALRALDLCAIQCRFGEVLFLSDTAPEHRLDGCRMEAIPRIGSVAEYSRFVLKELGRYIRTEHVLLVQWDGFIINPQSWRPEFLEYDYIGAPWGWIQDDHRVGNGGFSLRSRRLLDALLDEGITDLDPEDEAIGRRYRTLLETSYGIRFAPDEVAEAFSYETISPAGDPFGFHGFFNMWAVLPQQGLAEFVAALAPSTVASRQYLQLCKNYIELGCRVEASIVLARRLKLVPEDAEAGKLLALTASPRFGVPPPAPGRNDPCPCASGKRYKLCCGAIADMPAEATAKFTREQIRYLQQIAMGHHHAGRLTEAEAAYRQILEHEPKNTAVLQYLGILVTRRGDPAAGERLIHRALDLRGFSADFHNHLGYCLGLKGRSREAQECYRHVLAIRPDDAAASGNLDG
jgi:tetratricopeptide (TPR) repeat protein